MTNPLSYYQALNNVISAINLQCKINCPDLFNKIEVLTNDVNYGAYATQEVINNITALQTLHSQMADVLSSISWDNI